jgi:hypothetical protein
MLDTADQLLASLLAKGGAIIHTGQIPDSADASGLVGGKWTDNYVRPDGVAFVRVDCVPVSIPHVGGDHA